MFYVKMMTRGARGSAKGSPRQAVRYISDGHDLRRAPEYSRPELQYIARMGDGWKTDLDGGRVPLFGIGTLAGVADQRQLADDFERSCVPDHDRRATVGYKAITFTLPKEVSLFADGHREVARAAINAA